MSENIFRKSRADMAIVQSHLSMFDEDRSRCIRALSAMKVAEEMHALLERISEGNIIYIENGEMDDDIKKLLAKACGETKTQ